MRFTISRTSQYGETQPCPEATRGKVPTHSYYTFRTITEALKRYPDLVFEKVDGQIRTVGELTEQWVVDIESLEDLMSIYEREGSLIIEADHRSHRQPHIEIYDRAPAAQGPRLRLLEPSVVYRLRIEVRRRLRQRRERRTLLRKR